MSVKQVGPSETGFAGPPGPRPARPAPVRKFERGFRLPCGSSCAHSGR